MSWFNHRTQLGSDGPAGVPYRRESVACAPVRGDGAGQAAPADSTPPGEQLRFTVRYGLPEYLSFMWQHGRYLIRRRRVGRLASWFLLSRSTAAAAMHFVAQGRSRHLYDFTIDEHGIIRSNGTGVTLVAWTDVSAIRRYSRGYMMVLKRGTLPIPFRCLSHAQAELIDQFAAGVKAARQR